MPCELLPEKRKVRSALYRPITPAPGSYKGESRCQADWMNSNNMQSMSFLNAATGFGPAFSESLCDCCRIYISRSYKGESRCQADWMNSNNMQSMSFLNAATGFGPAFSESLCDCCRIYIS